WRTGKECQKPDRKEGKSRPRELYDRFWLELQEMPSLTGRASDTINMAVLERSYKPYAGTLSPEWSPFLIIPRHAYRDVFRSKIFTGFFVVSFVWPLVCAILIYLHYNTTALVATKIQVRDLLAIDASFFQNWLVWPQC